MSGSEMTLLAGTHVLKAALPEHLQENHLTCIYRYNQTCTLKLKLRIKLVYKHDINLINHKSTGLFGPHKALGRGVCVPPPTPSEKFDRDNLDWRADSLYYCIAR